MTETYLPFCVRQDGPKNKRGYYSIGPTRSLVLVEGEVKHSAEGYKQSMLNIIHDARLEKSWPLSIFKEGPPYQHYALEDVCWINDGPSNNLKYIGMEHEGVAGEPLTPNQIHWTIRISQAIRELCPKVAANPPTRRVNLWEHRELPGTSTACPSGRIPWNTIISALTVKEEPTSVKPVEEEIEMFLAKDAKNGMVYIVGPEGKRWIDDGVELQVYQRKLGFKVEEFYADEMATLPTVK